MYALGLNISNFSASGDLLSSLQRVCGVKIILTSLLSSSLLPYSDFVLDSLNAELSFTFATRCLVHLQHKLRAFPIFH